MGVQRQVFVFGCNVMNRRDVPLSVLVTSSGNCESEVCSFADPENLSTNTFICAECFKIRHPCCAGTVLLQLVTTKSIFSVHYLSFKLRIFISGL